MRGRHRLTDRQWCSYMGERNERAARIAKLRDERIDAAWTTSERRRWRIELAAILSAIAALVALLLLIQGAPR